MIKTISDIETDCQLKGIDIETAYSVCIARIRNPSAIRQLILEDIIPKVTLYGYTMFSTSFVCDGEMMTYLELTYGDYITYAHTYKEWRKSLDSFV